MGEYKVFEVNHPTLPGGVDEEVKGHTDYLAFVFSDDGFVETFTEIFLVGGDGSGEVMAFADVFGQLAHEAVEGGRGGEDALAALIGHGQGV